MNGFVEITSSKRKKKKMRNERNKEQRRLTVKLKKELCKELESFFYQKERKEIGWWFLLGY